MKTCTKCDVSKEENNFNLVRNSDTKLRAECKDCLAEYRIKNKDKIKKWRIGYRNKNRLKVREWNKTSQKRNKTKRVSFINELKKVGCSVCGKIFPQEAMDLDHINPEDEIDSVAALRAIGRPEQLITNEMLKCQVLCAVCHRIKSIKEMRNH